MGCEQSTLSFVEAFKFDVAGSYTVRVKTADRKGAGTDANVSIRFIDKDERQTAKLKLDVVFRDDFEEGRLDEFRLKDIVQLNDIDKIELSRDKAGDLLLSADWYPEFVEVKIEKTKGVYIFPVNRWIPATRIHRVQQYDVTLPSDDPNKEQRDLELKEKRKSYEYEEKTPGVPVQVKTPPPDEQFTNDYKWDLDKVKLEMGVKFQFKTVSSAFQCFEKLQDLENLFKQDGRPWDVPIPLGLNHWKEDRWFGCQRLAGCNPILIKLCKAIPEKLGVTPDMVAPFLEGMTLEEAMEKKRIYIVDLEILTDMKCKENYTMCAPLALFYVTNEKILLPIAIQLNQEKGPENPVFLPNDDPNLWLLAKMWYSLADATYHQCLSHLGFTHLKMESVSVCTHRNLSPSHPIFKLLAPHFHHLIAINARAIALLISPGGYVDNTMSCGSSGMLEFLAKGASMWRMDIQGDLVNDLKTREVDDPDALPNYHYRDDGLLVWQAIEKYVKKIVDLFYAGDDVVRDDPELQQWAHEMTAPYPQGIGLKGVPGDGKFETKDELSQTLTSIIFTCSATHAAVNFNQYDQYAFVPNYPGSLEGKPPTNKEPRTEEDIMKCVPTRKILLKTALVVKILSTRGTKRLGDFDVVYLYVPEARRAAQEMADELEKISKVIKERSKTRHFKYDVLDPAFIPNSISI